MTAPTDLQSDQALALAEQALQARQVQRADAICRKVLASDATNARAWHLSGLVALHNGDPQAASRMVAQSLALNPTSAVANSDMGMLLTGMKRPGEAKPYLQKALTLDPKMFGAHLNMGNCLRDLGNPASAEAHYRIAVGYNPRYVPALLNLSSVLNKMGRAEEAQDAAEKALEIEPNNPVALSRLGEALDRQGHLEKAVAAYRKATDIRPKDATIRTAYARSLASFGRMQEARAELEKVLDRDPGHIGALYQIVDFKKYREPDAHTARMEALYADPATGDLPRSNLGFALAKVAQDMGDYEKAMQLLIEANRMRRGFVSYSSDATAAMFADIAAAFTPEIVKQFEGAGNPDPTPIFILGMPRSGTTLTEQIIAAHPDVTGVGEMSTLTALEARWRGELGAKSRIEALNATTPEFLKELGEAYVRQVRKYSSSARFIVDKMPANFLHVGLIRLILPNAKIVHTRRGAADTCLSIFRQSFNRNAQAYGYDMQELGGYYRHYAALMAHWHALLPGAIFDSQYEELVADQETASRALLAHCGLDWTDQVLDFHQGERPVHTASIAQVRQPIYTSSVGLSQKYGTGIAPLIEALGPELTANGTGS